MSKTLVVNILILVVVILVIWWLLSRGKSKGKIFLSYQFYKHFDSPGGDINYLPELSGNVEALKKACNETTDCVAFNTAGYLKKYVKPNEFIEYSGYPDWAGLYVKRKELRS